MTLQHTEVAVVGGGMVGGALALGLGQPGFGGTVRWGWHSRDLR